MLEHLDDLESDFSAIHHIHIDFEAEQYGGLSSRRFFALAGRIMAYPGVVQARYMAEEQRRQEDHEGVPITDTDRPRTAPRAEPGVKVIPLTPELLANGVDALGLSGVVEYATSG
ncbi:MAG TPA: hypothetical protein VF516_00210 [Kofleriaceae bacterium]